MILRFARCFACVLMTMAFVDRPLRAQEEEPLVLQEEDGGVGALAISSDGKRLATGGHYKDRSLLWNLETGKPIAELSDNGGLVESVSFSSDGKLLVTAGLDSSKSQWKVVLWDGLTGKRQLDLPPNTGWRAEIMPGGKSLAVATLAGPIAFYQLPRGQRSGEMKTDALGGVNVLAAAPDGKLLTTARENKIFVWSVPGGKTLAKFTTGSPVQSLAFAQDSKSLLAGCDDGTLSAWTVSNQRSIFSRKIQEKPIREVAVAPNGKYVAAAVHERLVCLLDPAKGDEIRRIEGVVGSVQSVAISPDSKSIAVGHSGGVAIWKCDETGKPVARAKRPAGAVTVNGHAYAVIREHLPWPLAQQYCKAAGGHLATFKTSAQREVVLKLCREANEAVWLGATDVVEEGRWLWVNGESVAAGELSTWIVDNQNAAQHWLCYWKDTANFDDAYGGERLFFLCEWDD